MSGIVAMATGSREPIDQAVLARMLNQLERRGPDAQSYWLDGTVALGHTALHTTYESQAEAQPSTLDGRSWLTADVRIDDRAIVIAKLRAAGREVARGVSDDHLVLHAYSVWGVDCVDHLMGDFAFALWDDDTQTVFCATDQFGVAPLYFATPSGGLIVSNTLNCIRLHPGVTDTLCDQAIGDYLLFRMNTDLTTTTLADIHKVPAGHRMIWKNGESQTSRYWAPGEPDYRRRSEADYHEEFGALFEQAVLDRLRADAAGTHVSGGMDSTSVAAVLASAKKADGSSHDVRAYTQTYLDASLRVEQPFAQLVADKLHLPIQFHPGHDAGPMFDSDFRDAGTLPPEPSFVTSSAGRQRIFEDVQSYGNVLFAGFGGDPLLDPTVHDRGQPGGRLTKLADARQHWQTHGEFPRQLIPFRGRKKPQRADTAGNGELPGWVVGDFAARIDLADRQARHRIHSGPLTNRRQSMADHGLWRKIFDWHDPGFSGVPVKVRFPFFDVRLVTWAMSVPPDPWFYKKYLLRELMREKLPPEIVERPKTALPGNALRFKLESPGSMAGLRAALQEPQLEPFVNAATFLDSVENAKTLTSGNLKAIMRVASLAIWLGMYQHSDAWSANQNDEHLTRFIRRSAPKRGR